MLYYGNFFWWERNPALVCYSTQTKKQKGGLGVPNFQNYYFATHLARIVDWHCHCANKDWVQLEELSSAIPLAYTLWIVWPKCSLDIKHHPLIGATLSTRWTAIALSLLSLNNDPDFPPGLNDTSLLKLADNTPVLAKHCVRKGRILSYEGLLDALKPIVCTPWSYRQIHNFLSSHSQEGFS